MADRLPKIPVGPGLRPDDPRDDRTHFSDVEEVRGREGARRRREFQYPEGPARREDTQALAERRRPVRKIPDAKRDRDRVEDAVGKWQPQRIGHDQRPSPFSARHLQERAAKIGPADDLGMGDRAPELEPHITAARGEIQNPPWVF